MTPPERSRSTRVLYRAVSWTGIVLFSVGTLVSMWSGFTFVQVRTGWGLTAHERCCVDLGRAALGGALSGMFFVLIGSAVILLLHPIRMLTSKARPRRLARWMRVLSVTLGLYALLVFALATVLAGMAEELNGVAVGLVSYCMLVGVGMVAAAWGFRRASEVR